MNESQQTGTPAASKNAPKLCAGKIADIDNVWELLRGEARRIVADEPTLVHLVDDVILSRETLAAALGARLARRLGREDMPRDAMEPLLTVNTAMVAAPRRVVRNAARWPRSRPAHPEEARQPRRRLGQVDRW